VKISKPDKHSDKPIGGKDTSITKKDKSIRRPPKHLYEGGSGTSGPQGNPTSATGN
jgi:hypothetical protein